MKTKFLTALLCIMPLLAYAQNYEQQGDELFAQAQYAKALKKYSAAIEMSGATSSLKTKKEKCSKCASLLARAKAAEESASTSVEYENAGSLYNELYSLHSLSSYKSKATQLQKKADAIRIEQERIEQAEQERIAQERQRADSIRREAQKERERQEQIKHEEEKMRSLLNNSNITMKELLDHPLGVKNIQWMDSREILFEKVKKQLENGYSNTVYTGFNYVHWRLFGFIEKELTLYYRVWSVSLVWKEPRGGGVDIEYKIGWRIPEDSRSRPQEKKNVLEYLKNDIEQYGITFTDTIINGIRSQYYTQKKNMINSINYVRLDMYRDEISLEILFHFDSRSQTTQRYLVSKGESLYRIAHKFGVSEEDILKINPEVEQNGLREGLMIYIPKK